MPLENMLQIQEGQIIVVVYQNAVKIYKVRQHFYYNTREEHNVPQLLESLLAQRYLLEMDYMTWVVRE